VYDTTKITEEELDEKGFAIFLDEKYKGDIYLYDSERDSFMMALKNLGYSMNTENEAELQEAYEWLKTCVETMEPGGVYFEEFLTNSKEVAEALRAGKYTLKTYME
jgi:spermidine/putrescine transport system permease protein